MSDDQRRIFIYKPPAEEARTWRSRVWTERLRAWLFSVYGLVIVWMLNAIILLPLAGLIALTLREDYVVLVLSGTLWLLLGICVVHWWIPAARRANRRSEGVAAAGWHILLSVTATGLVGTQFLLGEGLRPAFTLADTVPVIASGVIAILFFGIAVIRARGHNATRTGRYSVVSTSFITVWMALWLVAEHAGLLGGTIST